jgi:uncharacterized membrane protein
VCIGETLACAAWWLGHPLHPVLTAVPIGAWTTALALDAKAAASGDDCGAAQALAVAGISLASHARAAEC